MFRGGPNQGRGLWMVALVAGTIARGVTRGRLVAPISSNAWEAYSFVFDARNRLRDMQALWAHVVGQGRRYLLDAFPAVQTTGAPCTVVLVDVFSLRFLLSLRWNTSINVLPRAARRGADPPRRR